MLVNKLNVYRCKCLSCVFSFPLLQFVSSQGKNSVFVESGLDLRLYKCLNIICMCMMLLLVLGYFILATKQCSENVIDDFISDNCLSFFNLMHFSTGASELEGVIGTFLFFFFTQICWSIFIPKNVYGLFGVGSILIICDIEFKLVPFSSSFFLL